MICDVCKRFFSAMVERTKWGNQKYCEGTYTLRPARAHVCRWSFVCWVFLCCVCVLLVSYGVLIVLQVLRKFVDDASRFLNDKGTKAGRIAGLDVLRSINDPTAAGLWFWKEEQWNNFCLRSWWWHLWCLWYFTVNLCYTLNKC